MKLLLTISLLLSSLLTVGQVTYTWRYYSATSGSDVGYYSVGMPSDSLTNSNKRAAFFFHPGNGETGAGNATEANAVKFGTSRDLKLGLWNGGVRQSNGYADSVVYPVYVVIQSNDADGSVGNVSRLKDLFNTFFPSYSWIIDTDQMHVAALSIGGRETLLSLANYGGTGSNIPYSIQYASAFIASAGGRSANITDNAATIGSWAVKGGRMSYQTGADDITIRYDTATVMEMMNDSVPGSAVGHTWVYADGFSTQGHGGWDTLWRYNRHWPWLNGLTPFEWQLQFTKAPMAIAQTTINTSGSSVTLNGVSNGWYKTVGWTKVSGPAATITSANSDTTGVTGLSAGSYVFRMTVTNTNDSRTAVHDVTVNVTAPSSGATFIKKRGRKAVFKVN